MSKVIADFRVKEKSEHSYEAGADNSYRLDLRSIPSDLNAANGVQGEIRLSIYNHAVAEHLKAGRMYRVTFEEVTPEGGEAK